MSYNILNLPDGSVEGHKYSGGGVISYFTLSYVDVNTLSYTASEDGLFEVSVSKQDGGNTIFIHVNSVLVWQFASFFSYPSASIMVPVKKDDVITVSSDCSSAGVNTWTVDRVFYRYR